MSESANLERRMAEREVILLDGAIGSQLQTMGVPMSGFAWAAAAPPACRSWAVAAASRSTISGRSATRCRRICPRPREFAAIRLVSPWR